MWAKALGGGAGASRCPSTWNDDVLSEMYTDAPAARRNGNLAYTRRAIRSLNSTAPAHPCPSRISISPTGARGAFEGAHPAQVRLFAYPRTERPLTETTTAADAKCSPRPVKRLSFDSTAPPVSTAVGGRQAQEAKSPPTKLPTIYPRGRDPARFLFCLRLVPRTSGAPSGPYSAGVEGTAILHQPIARPAGWRREPTRPSSISRSHTQPSSFPRR